MYSFRQGPWIRIGAAGAFLILLLCAQSLAAASGFTGFLPTANAHAGLRLRPDLPADALPTAYDPSPNQILPVPPEKVQITFGEQIKPELSKIVVVNASNQEVDDQDSRLSAGGHILTVTLPLLPAGTYVVLWRSDSARDEHIAGGSYEFSIARADGTVPALSGPLPKDTLVGGSVVAPSQNVTGPSILGAASRWLGLLGLTPLLGMLFWWAMVQPRQHLSLTLTAEIERRMRQAASLALLLILVASLLEVAAQALGPAGFVAAINSLLSWSDSSLWGSRFGHAILAGAALALAGLLALWRWPKTLNVAPRDPRHQRLLLLAYGAVLALAFEYSGPAVSSTAWWGPLIDYLHLLANGIWLGGLLCLAAVVIPALQTRSSRERQGYLAASISQFGIPALLAVTFIIVTGPLDATARMSSLQQLWTTAYGALLFIITGLFLAIVAISYYHAFVLRPRLAQLTRATGVTQIAGSETASRKLHGPPVIGKIARDLGGDILSRASPSAISSLTGGRSTLSSTGTELDDRASELWALNQEVRIGGGHEAGSLAEKKSEVLAQVTLKWLRFEAILGVGVLLGAALLGPLSGALPVSSTSGASFGSSAGAQTFTRQVDGLAVTLSVSPGQFGNNTFTILVENPNGAPANSASVSIVTTMELMDMGTNTIALTPATTAGTYSGHGNIPMAGNWRLQVVVRTQQDPSHAYTTTFTIDAGYPLP
ncbi:MAG: copper resistance CopC/CopD family protein [Ktedonobacterales bacterium]